MTLKLVFRVLVLTVCTALGASCGEDPCVEFAQLIKSTYGFKPSKLSKEEQASKSKEMDKVWNAFKAKPKDLAACLEAAIADPKADAFLRFDASNMLMTFAPSDKAKLTQVQAFATVELEDVDPELWVGTIALRGAEGLDTSVAVENWLKVDKARAKYYLVVHGGFEVPWDLAVFFLYGSMDEKFATPSLLKILAQKDHPARDQAIPLLFFQATRESAKALKELNQNSLSAEERTMLGKLLNSPALAPRAKPKVTREECVAALQDLGNGKRERFEALIAKEQDCEADMVAVLKPEDMPVLRQARRRNISRANQHVIENHTSFTKVIQGLLARPDFAEK